MSKGLSPKFWILFSGWVWVFVGFSLYIKGVFLLLSLENQLSSTSILVISSVIGIFKGKLVLSKSVSRLTQRMLALSKPIQFLEVYPKSYWLLLSSMFLLGMILRVVPTVWRGGIDVAVGSGLLFGAYLYFKSARSFVVTRARLDGK